MPRVLSNLRTIRVKPNVAMAAWDIAEIGSWDATDDFFNIKKPTADNLDFISKLLIVTKALAINDIATLKHYEITRATQDPYSGTFLTYTSKANTSVLTHLDATIWGGDNKIKMIFEIDRAVADKAGALNIDLWPLIFQGHPAGVRKLHVKMITKTIKVNIGVGIIPALVRPILMGYGEQIANYTLGQIWGIAIDAAANRFYAGATYSDKQLWKYNSSEVLQWSYKVGNTCRQINLDYGGYLLVASDYSYDADALAAPAWVDDTDYVLWEEVIDSGVGYFCQQAHHSTTGDRPGAGANWREYWVFNYASLRKFSNAGSLQWRFWLKRFENVGGGSIYYNRGFGVAVDSEANVYFASDPCFDFWQWWYSTQWVATTYYNAGDTVWHPYDWDGWYTGKGYFCRVGHTADAAKEPGVGADWEDYWYLDTYTLRKLNSAGIVQWRYNTARIANVHWQLDSGDPWYIREEYYPGDFVFNIGESFRCTQYHEASNDLEPGVGYSWQTVWIKLPLMNVAVEKLVFDEWVDSTYYAVSAKSTVYPDVYNCIQSHTSQTARDKPGSGSNWTEYWEIYVPAEKIVAVGYRSYDTDIGYGTIRQWNKSGVFQWRLDLGMISYAVRDAFGVAIDPDNNVLVAAGIYNTAGQAGLWKLSSAGSSLYTMIFNKRGYSVAQYKGLVIVGTTDP